MYEGHMPNGSGIQKHSAGELFPVIIVHYGDGQARWVDPEKRRASAKSSDVAEVWKAAKSYRADRHHPVWCIVQEVLRDNYEEFVNESAR